MGTYFDRDTDRMVANELTLDLEGGYIITDKELGKKEKKFNQQNNIQLPWATPMSITNIMTHELTII